MCTADPERKSALPCARPPVSKRSRAATSWSRRGAFRTPPGSGLRRPALSWTVVATFASTSGWRRLRPSVWAIGECAGSPQFTHVSVDDFRIIRDNLAGGKRSTRDRLVPYCMFTDPPLAHVGLSEGEAQRQGVTVRVAKLPMSAVLRTQATDETTRLHEGSCRWERRPHSRLHDDRLRGRRGHGRGANGDAGRPAIFEAPRRHSRAPDDGGGTRLRSSRMCRPRSVQQVTPKSALLTA